MYDPYPLYYPFTHHVIAVSLRKTNQNDFCFFPCPPAGKRNVQNRHQTTARTVQRFDTDVGTTDQVHAQRTGRVVGRILSSWVDVQRCPARRLRGLTKLSGWFGTGGLGSEKGGTAVLQGLQRDHVQTKSCEWFLFFCF